MAEKDAQLTQRQLSRDTGISVSAINRLFRNDFDRLDKHTIEVLCDYFQCDPGQFFDLR